MKDMCIDKYGNCPTHPEFLLELICINKTCIEPLCRRCVPEHREIHRQLRSVDRIRELSDVKTDYLKKQALSAKRHQSVNRHRVNEIINNIVEDYFKRKNVEIDGRSTRQISEVKSILDMMVEENRVEIGEDFKAKLFGFLRYNLIANTDQLS